MQVGRTSKAKRTDPMVPARLVPLVRELAALSVEERHAVIAAANQTQPPRRATVSWGSLKAASGMVQIGGDAVEDGEHLYEG